MDMHAAGGNYRVCACGKLKNNTAQKQNGHSQQGIRCGEYTKYPNIRGRTSRKFITQVKTTLLPAKTYGENWKKHRRRFCFMRFRTTYAVHYRRNSVNGLVILCTRKYCVHTLH